MSMELREGRVVLQFNSGTGVVRLETTRTYNNNNWIQIAAKRQHESKWPYDIQGVYSTITILI